MKNILCVFTIFCVGWLTALDPIRPLTTKTAPIAKPAAAPTDPVARLDRTIALTQKHCEGQKALRVMLCQYLEFHEKFEKRVEDRELSYKLIKQAHAVLAKIKELNLAHAFDQELLGDLAFFAGIIEKWEGLDSLSSTD